MQLSDFYYPFCCFDFVTTVYNILFKLWFPVISHINFSMFFKADINLLLYFRCRIIYIRNTNLRNWLHVRSKKKHPKWRKIRSCILKAYFLDIYRNVRERKRGINHCKTSFPLQPPWFPLGARKHELGNPTLMACVRLSHRER